ncbi:MAG: spermidine synthase [Acidobacteria bacterium]|uniref:Spermidine synthase n=1 Tax=Candidatus Polarisedimenticola svalbardensis TaxID=2886004 RepID=A0A8J6Y1K0_9BACT|nr:spermidine synthase [Candidatus Polarisedimenticola svalbardensis]
MTNTRANRLVPIILLLFFLSGATALVYQVIWLRQLILIFGSTLFATSSILATFMGGLALGAFLAGRSMDRSGRAPLQVYGLLEIIIGVYALLVPFLFQALTPVYQMVWNSGGSDSQLLLNLAKFAGIALVLLPPTTLMGASLPVLARAVADDPERIGGNVGTLYAINTFGAVAGTFIAGFVAIPSIGVRDTLWLTAAVNLTLGIVALIAGRTRASRETGPGPSQKRSPRLTRPVRVALIAFGVSGFGAMVLEVAWTRALSMVLGSSIYAFSLMLLAFLLGLAGGGAFFSRLLKRRPGLDAGILLACLFSGSGILAFTTAYILQVLPRIFGLVYFEFAPTANQWYLVQFGFCLLVMFPATFAFGGIFPSVLQLHARDLENVAGSVGTVYASNTVGTILGAACAGFLLIPGLGVLDSVIFVAAVQILLGIGMVLLVSRAATGTRRVIAVVLLAAVAAVFVLRPGWDLRLMNSGVYVNLVTQADDADWDEFESTIYENNEVVYAREGMTAAVMVGYEPAFENYYLSVNGKVEASTHGDMETQLLAAHLPLMLHPSPRDVMLIGLASGITGGAATAHPIESLRIVEVEAAMEEAARVFDRQNRNVLDDPRTTLSINDARNELVFSPNTYDVIISEPSNPWMTVASNLFTEEFFALSKVRLRPDGIFCQWVQNYNLGGEELRSIIGAFRSAYEHVLLFETFGGVDNLLLGSDSPILLDLPRMESRMNELTVRMDLARVDLRRTADILRLFRIGTREIDILAEGAPRNTDDNARVEFAAPKAIYINNLAENMEFLQKHSSDFMDYITPTPATAGERDRIILDTALAWQRRGIQEFAAKVAKRALDGPLAEEAGQIVSADNGKNP